MSWKERAETAWKFAKSGLGKTVIISVTVAAIAGWIYHRGEVRGAAPVAGLQEQVATLKSQLDEARKAAGEIRNDAESARSKASDLDGRLKAAEAERGQLNQKVESYVRELAKRKTPAACVVTPADVWGLQRIQ
jgi:uncharacterized coiled-coil DUF342 family protein